MELLLLQLWVLVCRGRNSPPGLGILWVMTYYHLGTMLSARKETGCFEFCVSEPELQLSLIAIPVPVKDMQALFHEHHIG